MSPASHKSKAGDGRTRDALAALALALWTGGVVWALDLDDPRLRYPSFLGAYALSAMGWLWLSRAACRGELTGKGIKAAIALGLGLRIACLASPPAFSDDVFRYVYEGRVIWAMGPTFPFVHAPARAREAGVPEHLLDDAWRRINHSDLTTIYPPLSQLVFASAAAIAAFFGGGHLFVLKTILLAADLGTWALLARALHRRRRPAAESLVYGLSPLVLFEIAREGHADSLSMLFLALGALGFLSLDPRTGHLGFALAALAKLNGLAALFGGLRATRRGVAPCLFLLIVLALFLAAVGLQGASGLSAFATAWRAGDGVFSILLGAAEWALGGDWTRVSGVTITKHEIARGMAGALLLALSLLIVRRRPEIDEVPERAGLLLLALLLCSPTLHPWYALWLLPFAAISGRARAAMLVLVSLAPLLHHPGWIELTAGEWTDLGWIRALVHIPVWALLFGELVGVRGLGYASRVPASR